MWVPVCFWLIPYDGALLGPNSSHVDLLQQTSWAPGSKIFSLSHMASENFFLASEILIYIFLEKIYLFGKVIPDSGWNTLDFYIFQLLTVFVALWCLQVHTLNFFSFLYMCESVNNKVKYFVEHTHIHGKVYSKFVHHH